MVMEGHLLLLFFGTVVACLLFKKLLHVCFQQFGGMCFSVCHFIVDALRRSCLRTHGTAVVVVIHW